MREIKYLAILLIAIVFYGCASVKTTLTPDWSADVGEIDNAFPAPDGSALVLHRPGSFLKKGGLVVIDGRTGKPLAHQTTKIEDLLKEGIYVGNMSLTDVDAKNLDFHYLEGLDLLLVLRSSTTRNDMYCIDLNSGNQLWNSNNYRWTLENFQALGAKVAGKLASSFGLATGAAASIVSTELTRSRMLSRLIIPVPELDAFLFKNLSELYLIQARTGQVIWSTGDVTGSGFTQVTYLPAAQEFLLMTMSTGLIDAATHAKELIRLDGQTGEIVWTATYDGRDDMARHLARANDYVLIDYQGGLGEVFRFKTGEKVLQTKDELETAMGNMFKNSLVSGKFTSAPVFSDRMVFAAQTSNLKAVGVPDWVVQGYDLQSGKSLWESKPIESMADIRDLQLVDGVLIASATGLAGPYQVDNSLLGLNDRCVVALDPETGEQVWRQVIDKGGKISNLVVVENKLYVGDAEAIHQINLTNGKIKNSANFKDQGTGDLLQLKYIHGDLVAIGSKGIARLSLPNLSVKSASSFPMRMINGTEAGDFVFGYMGVKGLVAINTPDETISGYVEFPEKLKHLSEDPSLLGTGFFIGSDGHVIYVLNKEEGTLTRYHI